MIHPGILLDIATGARLLDQDPVRGERGMVDGRRTSTPASRRAPADLDRIVLTDRRTGVLAVLTRWSRMVLPMRSSSKYRSVESEVAVLRERWSWAVAQPWGPQMVAELHDLAASLDALNNPTGESVRVRRCPACGLPVRLDRIVVEHRECLDTPL